MKDLVDEENELELAAEESEMDLATLEKSGGRSSHHQACELDLDGLGQAWEPAISISSLMSLRCA